ncbi:type II secretion system minor pseudopilin GspH [Ferrimonas aestuarii]|uniref:Type II secretion system protein H n=1 Tax=Ferrimonas aestuarii TaxID=2569539 RepID=A0A4U1BU98_9GAMM|nr:type II secretion system minor pseudopilin GspH [Ferrimonas aestuarii]TKB56223.1 type II secretion system protein GspH [Ferrimonas aestuarii]
MQKLRQQQGFTLLEMLLVLFLIGVAAMTVTLTISGDPRREALQEAANEFQTVVSMAIEESVLSGQELGVVVEPDHYFFARFNIDENDWEPLVGDALYRERRLPEDTFMSLTIEGLPLQQADEDDESEFGFDESLFEESEEDKKKSPEPQLLILPSGEITPFLVEFENDSARPKLSIELKGNAIGQIMPAEEAE